MPVTHHLSPQHTVKGHPTIKCPDGCLPVAGSIIHGGALIHLLYSLCSLQALCLIDDVIAAFAAKLAGSDRRTAPLAGIINLESAGDKTPLLQHAQYHTLLDACIVYNLLNAAPVMVPDIRINCLFILLLLAVAVNTHSLTNLHIDLAAATTILQLIHTILSLKHFTIPNYYKLFLIFIQ